MMQRWLLRKRRLLRIIWALDDLGASALALWVYNWGHRIGMLPALPVIAGGVDTAVASGAAEAVELWEKDIWVEHLEKIFWGPYTSEKDDAIIVRLMNLEKEKGELVNYSLLRQLTGDGVLDDNRQEDNEEEMRWFSDDVTLRQFRNAVRLQGKLSEKRTAFDQGEKAKGLLRDWLAAFSDNRIFTTLATSPTRAIYGGDATSTALIDSGDYLTLSMLTRAKTVARKATPQIIAPMIKEGDYFLAVITPDSAYDLKTYDPGYHEAHREAMQRGPTNPLFTGADFIYDGVVGRVSTRVPLATDWGSGANLNGSENMFMGIRAGVLAMGRKPEMVVQAFDYENKIGFAIRVIMEVAKSTFDGTDHGVIFLRTHRSNIS